MQFWGKKFQCGTKHAQNSNAFLGKSKTFCDIDAKCIPTPRNTPSKNLPVWAAHTVTKYSGVPPPPGFRAGLLFINNNQTTKCNPVNQKLDSINKINFSWMFEWTKIDFLSSELFKKETSLSIKCNYRIGWCSASDRCVGSKTKNYSLNLYRMQWTPQAK